MHIIDDLTREPSRYDPNAGFAPSARNPVLFLNEEGKAWTLGMVLSMWECVFTQSNAEVCRARAIPF